MGVQTQGSGHTAQLDPRRMVVSQPSPLCYRAPEYSHTYPSGQEQGQPPSLRLGVYQYRVPSVPGETVFPFVKWDYDIDLFRILDAGQGQVRHTGAPRFCVPFIRRHGAPPQNLPHSRLLWVTHTQEKRGQPAATPG